MAQAKYTIHVPQLSMSGERLPDLAQAAHHYLTLGHAPLMGAMIDRDKHIAWDHHTGPHDLVVAYGEDTPEVDSHAKQIGAYIGEVSQHPTTYVSKDAKGGHQTWPVNTRRPA